MDPIPALTTADPRSRDATDRSPHSPAARRRGAEAHDLLVSVFDAPPAADQAGTAIGREAHVHPGPLIVVMTFAEALRHHDPGAAAVLFEPGARLLTPDHTEVSGREAVGEILAKLTSLETRLDVQPGRTIVKDDAALCTQSWRLRAATDGPCYERSSSAFFLLRWASDRWRIAIAAPWG